MRKAVLLGLCGLLAVVLLPGCLGLVTGSGELDTRQFDYSGFTRVEVGHAFDAEITQSDSFSISITADDNLFDYIVVTKSGSTLKIDLRAGNSYLNVTKEARVTMPGLERLSLSGATRGTISGFSSTGDFNVSLSGASSLDMADIAAGNVNFDISGASRVTGDITAGGDADIELSGASRVTLAGSAGDLRLDASGGSNAELDSFPVGDADVNLSGGSRATVNLDGRLDADISGGSHLDYIGQPTLGDLDISGGSSVSKK